MSKNIVIVDYKIGNVKSVANMLRKTGASAEISADHQVISNADKIILPGVGAFDNAMSRLEQGNFITVLNDFVLNQKKPILGICLGMQLFARESEEGTLPGLGWIDGKVKKFTLHSSKLTENLKIPHMGWNRVTPSIENHKIFENVSHPMRFYFVHSYHFVCAEQDNILATSRYGYDFTCAIFKDNIYGVQFHPEKSHKFGMQVLKNFVEIA
jgi:imidazole glycerol-phosphate synthase subunit HisH